MPRVTTYHRFARVTSIKEKDGNVSNGIRTYDASNRLTSILRDNGVVIHYDYDARNNIKSNGFIAGYVPAEPLADRPLGGNSRHNILNSRRLVSSAAYNQLDRPAIYEETQSNSEEEHQEEGETYSISY